MALPPQMQDMAVNQEVEMLLRTLIKPQQPSIPQEIMDIINIFGVGNAQATQIPNPIPPQLPGFVPPVMPPIDPTFKAPVIPPVDPTFKPPEFGGLQGDPGIADPEIAEQLRKGVFTEGGEVEKEVNSFSTAKEFESAVRRGNLTHIFGEEKIFTPSEVGFRKAEIDRIKTSGFETAQGVRRESVKKILKEGQKDPILVAEYITDNGETRRFIIDGNNRAIASVVSGEEIKARVIHLKNRDSLSSQLKDMWERLNQKN